MTDRADTIRQALELGQRMRWVEDTDLYTGALAALDGQLADAAEQRAELATAYETLGKRLGERDAADARVAALETAITDYLVSHSTDQLIATGQRQPCLCSACVAFRVALAASAPAEEQSAEELRLLRLTYAQAQTLKGHPLRTVDAILAGKRDEEMLAAFRDKAATAPATQQETT